MIFLEIYQPVYFAGFQKKEQIIVVAMYLFNKQFILSVLREVSHPDTLQENA
jgi:hypothetical protein